MEPHLWMVLLGFGVGVIGTLIGAGGGFVLVPVLLLLYPNETPETITSISLAVIFFNALSGSIAYARMRRIHWKSAILFSAASVPGAIAGVLIVPYIPAWVFKRVFGGLLILLAAFLMFRPAGPRKDEGTSEAKPRYVLGTLISFFVGVIASLLGIGGGIIHVPVMVHLLGFPVHIATATSHAILAVTALSSSITHLSTGVLMRGLPTVALLSIGVVCGAQLGAGLSTRVRGVWIIRGLALALAAVAIRIVL